jgi:sigma-E factor negative regulatory protein RseA
MHPATPTPSDPQLWVSDLVDGRIDAGSTARACADWATDEQLRRTWHAYHLIGDVLRSDELARDPADDRAFLKVLHSRLRTEPVPLAPGPVRSSAARGLAFGSARRALRWGRPMAVAAGFVAVAGVVVALRTPAIDPATQPGYAAAGTRAPSGAGGGVLGADGLRLAVGGTAVPAERAGSMPRLEMLRDARLDEYLRAHREALAGSPAALPGGALRSVEFDAAAGR